MEKIIARFIKISVLYFIVGAGFGVTFVTFPGVHHFLHSGPGTLIKWTHVHLNVLGWVTLGLSGIIYWVVPQITGKPIYSVKLARKHFWMTNVGFIGMIILTFIFGYVGGKMYQAGVPENEIYAQYYGVLMIALAFTYLAYAGIITFAYNVWRSFSFVPAEQLEVRSEKGEQFRAA